MAYRTPGVVAPVAPPPLVPIETELSSYAEVRERARRQLSHQSASASSVPYAGGYPTGFSGNMHRGAAAMPFAPGPGLGMPGAAAMPMAGGIPFMPSDVPIPPSPTEHHQKIAQQLEYYLSIANLSNDAHLLNLLSPTGLAPLNHLASFHRMQLLTKDLAEIVTAVQLSSKLILRVDKFGAHWVGLFPQSYERSRCTLILLGIPPGTKTPSEIKELVKFPVYHVYEFPTGVWYVTFRDPSVTRKAFFDLQQRFPAGDPSGIWVRVRTDNVDRGFGDGGGPQFQAAPNRGLPGGLVAGAMLYGAFEKQALEGGLENSSSFADAVSGEGHFDASALLSGGSAVSLDGNNGPLAAMAGLGLPSAMSAFQFQPTAVTPFGRPPQPRLGRKGPPTATAPAPSTHQRFPRSNEGNGQRQENSTAAEHQDPAASTRGSEHSDNLATDNHHHPNGNGNGNGAGPKRNGFQGNGKRINPVGAGQGSVAPAAAIGNGSVDSRPGAQNQAPGTQGQQHSNSNLNGTRDRNNKQAANGNGSRAMKSLPQAPPHFAPEDFPELSHTAPIPLTPPVVSTNSLDSYASKLRKALDTHPTGSKENAPQPVTPSS